jgi:hypothetical protein
MKRRISRFGALVVALSSFSSVLLGNPFSMAATNSRGPVPATGSPSVTPMNGVVSTANNFSNDIADIEVDDETQKVFVSLPNAQRIDVFGYDGVLLGSIAIQRPTDMTLGGGYLFASSRGGGLTNGFGFDPPRLVQINKTTLEQTSFVADVQGLLYSDGWLYGVEPFYGRSSGTLVRIRPGSGERETVAEMVEPSQLVDPSPEPGMIFGLSGGYVTRIDPTNPNDRPRIQGGTCGAALDSGELLVGDRSGLDPYAVDTATMQESSRRWISSGVSVVSGVSGCDASGGAVVTSLGLIENNVNRVEIKIFDQENPGHLIRSFYAGEFDVMVGTTRMSQSGSKVAIGMVRNGTPQLVLLPGVALEGATPVNPPAATARAKAPSTRTVGGAPSRTAAPSANRPAPLELDQVDDWLVDPVSEHIYAVNSALGVLNVFDLEGNGELSLRNLAGARSISLCNGVLYVALYGSGDVIAVDKNDWSTQVAGRVPRPNKLLCSGGALFVASRNPISDSSATMTVFRLSGRSFVPTLVPGYWSLFAHDTTDEYIFANGGSWNGGLARIKKSTGEVLWGTGIPPTPYQTPQPEPVRLYPGGEKFLDWAGVRHDTATMQADGVQFFGASAVVSRSLPAYVAVRSFSDVREISIFAGNDPATKLNSFFLNPEYQFVTMEFAPGTRNLYVVLREIESGLLRFVSAPDILA